MKDFLTGFFKEEDGLGTIEMVIILVVLVALAFTFRKTLIGWYESLIDQTPTVEAPTIQNSKPITGQ